MIDDLISRQVAIDALDCINGVEEVLRSLPPAQPEIIRCEDCVQWTRTCGDDRWSVGDCSLFEKKLVMCKGYCAWAQRRTDYSDV